MTTIGSFIQSAFRFVAFAVSMSSIVPVSEAIGQTSSDDWVERSNANAQVLLEVMAKVSPEGAGRLGVPGLDEEIFDLKPGFVERSMEATRVAKEELETRLASETDSRVRQDLEILVDSAEQSLEGAELDLKYNVPYFDLHRTIFQGIRALLDDQIEPERRPAALARLRKYSGMEEGFESITQLAEAWIRSRMDDPELSGPFRGEVEKNLENTATYVSGIGQLFQKYEIEGYEEPYAALTDQLAAYERFVREEILARSRTDFRLPEELYSFGLKQRGVDIPPEELMSRAKISFREIQNEMAVLAAMIAEDRGLSAVDYRDVIRDLKSEQIVGEAILPFYEQRIEELEEIIAREDVVTLPEREMRIRLASEAESAAVPAPNMRPPRLLGNTGEMGEFVLPLRIPGADGEVVGFDDFTFDAAGWTLTVHEGRPGHELQFAALVESGVSMARAIFAFNSVNVEGWALYAEAEMKPYLPLEGQLVALQHRLMRAARAFLDPSLQLGLMTTDEAMRLIQQDVVLSEAMAIQEVERYTFWAPGQATSYFYGYQRLMELRTDVERILGDRFDRRAYHDFILSQGLIPPDLLRKAVMEEFVAREAAAAD